MAKKATKRKRTRSTSGSKPVKCGRKTSFKKEYIHLANSIVREYGSGTEKLARVLGTKDSTIRRWFRKGRAMQCPDFSGTVDKDLVKFTKTFDKAKEYFDTHNVESTLLKRALGYEYDETTVEHTFVTVHKGVGKARTSSLEPITKRKTVTKQIAPDPSCLQFWLINRQSDRWKNIKAVELTGAKGGPIRSATTKMTEAEAYACYMENIQSNDS